MSEPQWWLLDDLVLARSAIDRAAERRSDEEWVGRARADPASRFIHVQHGHALLEGDALVLTGPPSGASPISLLGVGEQGTATFACTTNQRKRRRRISLMAGGRIFGWRARTSMH